MRRDTDTYTRKEERVTYDALESSRNGKLFIRCFLSIVYLGLVIAAATTYLLL